MGGAANVRIHKSLADIITQCVKRRSMGRGLALIKADDSANLTIPFGRYPKRGVGIQVWAEVEQETNLIRRRLQIVQQLRLMFISQGLRRLQFNDNRIGHQQ